MNETKNITKQESFLPVAYFFDPAKTLTPQKLHFSPVSEFVQNNKALMEFFNWVTLVVIGIGFMKLSLNIVAGASLMAVALLLIDNNYHYPIDEECEFPLNKHSNLIVRQSNRKMASDYRKKSYPYFLYIKDPTRKIFKLIYLGQITDGKVDFDGDNDASRLFARYYDYIQKHHLNHRFKYMTYFERDPNIVNSDGVSQYILRGSGITLKINPNNQEIELKQDY